jgi:hypothetical protein
MGLIPPRTSSPRGRPGEDRLRREEGEFSIPLRNIPRHRPTLETCLASARKARTARGDQSD